MSFLHKQKAGIKYQESEMAKAKPESSSKTSKPFTKSYPKPASQVMNLSRPKGGKK